MILLTIPIVFPIVIALGYDPVWFGIIIVMVVELGLITPPIGMNVFVIKGLPGTCRLRRSLAARCRSSARRSPDPYSYRVPGNRAVAALDDGPLRAPRQRAERVPT